VNNTAVTLVIQHHIIGGAQADYEAWLKQIIPAAMGFDGHLGVNVIRPVAGSDRYTVVLRFDSHEHVDQWITSDTRKRLIAQVQPLLAKEEQRDLTTGLEYWFTPEDAPQKKAKPYKQFLVTLSAIYPLTVIVPWLLAPVIHGVPLLAYPLLAYPLLAKLLVALVIVGLMTYVIMPRYTKLIASWLFR